jgi:hypothetical protein
LDGVPIVHRSYSGRWPAPTGWGCGLRGGPKRDTQHLSALSEITCLQCQVTPLATRSGPTVESSEKGDAMYQPFTTGLANQRRDQLMHEAAMYRLTKDTRAAKTAEHRATVHRIVVGAVSLLIWPIKH